MVKRRKLIIGVGASLALAGCSADSETDSEGNQNNEPDGESSDESDSTEGSTEDSTEGSTEDSNGGSTDDSSDESTDSSSDESTGGSDSEYQVRVSYQGDWSGNIGTGGSSRSVDGSGTRTFDIDGDPFIVSANAQKEDGSSQELTVQILQDGEVIAEESTSSGYGLAQVTSEDSTSDDGGSGSSGSSFSVRVEYSGEWQGSISTGGSSRSVDGTGSQTIEIDGSPDIISANAQKQAANSETLVIQILENGEVVEETSTSAEYGVAQISYSNF